MGVDGRGTQDNDVDVGIRGRMGHLVYGVEAGLESILKMEGEISTSDPQPYRAEITNQITPEIPKVDGRGCYKWGEKADKKKGKDYIIKHR